MAYAEKIKADAEAASQTVSLSASQSWGRKVGPCFACCVHSIATARPPTLQRFSKSFQQHVTGARGCGTGHLQGKSLRETFAPKPKQEQPAPAVTLPASQSAFPSLRDRFDKRTKSSSTAADSSQPVLPAPPEACATGNSQRLHTVLCLHRCMRLTATVPSLCAKAGSGNVAALAAPEAKPAVTPAASGSYSTLFTPYNPLYRPLSSQVHVNQGRNSAQEQPEADDADAQPEPAVAAGALPKDIALRAVTADECAY